MDNFLYFITNWYVFLYSLAVFVGSFFYVGSLIAVGVDDRPFKEIWWWALGIPLVVLPIAWYFVMLWN